MAGSERTTGAEAAAASGTEARAEAAAASGTEARAPQQNERFSREEGSSWSETATLDAAGIRCECLMNARYHAAREAFLDTVHRWFMFGVICLGAVSLTDALPRAFHVILGIDVGSATIKEITAALAAILAALDLTFDLSNRARLHALMKRRYFELASDVVAGKETLLEAQACLDKFSADEEPAYYALLIASWNAAQEMVYGDDAKCYKIPRPHLWLKNVWRFGGKIYPMQPKPIRS
jgi:hypothetical protein